jgi:WD40 repeat protein
MSQSKSHGSPLQCLDWSGGNGSLVAAAGDSATVHVYRMSAELGEKVFEFKGHLAAVVSCKFGADSATLVTASLDTRVNVWDCLSGVLRQTLCHSYPVPQFVFGQAQVR